MTKLQKKYAFVFLLLLCFVINVWQYRNFVKTGKCSNTNIYFIYAFLYCLIVAVFDSFNVIKINLLIFITCLLSLESYYIFFEKGILTYNEQLGEKQYVSVYMQGYKYGYDAFNNWISKPNSTDIQYNKDFTYEKKYNSFGLRDVELDTAVLNRKEVVVILGDSFTEGNGTPQDSTMPALLEQKLNASDAGRYKIINAGVAGSDPVYEYQLYATKLAALKPQQVILATNVSDIFDLMCKKGAERFAGTKIQYYKAPVWEYLYANSRVFRLLVVQVFDVDPYLLITEAEKTKRFEKAYSDFKLYIQKFETTAKQSNSTFTVVYTPHLFDFKNVSSTMHLDDAFEQRLKLDYSKNTFNNSFIFLRDSIIKYKLIDTAKMDAYYWKHDYHFKPLGYDVWARFMEMELKKQ